MKAYATRVGAGPFPTELLDDTGEYLSRVGNEFGSVTGRRRRCGWFDAVALRRSVVHNSCSLLCVTKLDVLDGLDTISVCVGYKTDAGISTSPPLLSSSLAECAAVYEEMPGWKKVPSALPITTRSAGECAQVPGAIAGARRCSYYNHFHRSLSGSDDYPQESVQLSSRRRLTRGRQAKTWRSVLSWVKTQALQRARGIRGKRSIERKRAKSRCRGARIVAPADPTERLEVTVLVRRGASQEFQSRVSQIAAGNFPGPCLTREEFAKRHGADAADLSAVSDFAAANGLKVVLQHAARRTVVLSGTVAQFSAAFNVELQLMRHDSCSYRGRTGCIHLPGFARRTSSKRF